MQLIQIQKRQAKKEKEKAIGEVGGFSQPSKMPCYSWSIPAQLCKTGSKLAKIEGSVCHGCYALKGFYHMPSTKNAMRRRYGKIKNKNFVKSFVAALQGETFFRWFDSGDLQSMGMLQNIVEIAKQTPHCKHWLPTKEVVLVSQFLKSGKSFPENLTVRVSAPMINQVSHSTVTGQGSIVLTDFSMAPIGAIACNAPKQDGKCLECRACWKRDVATIAYLKH
jgi:hypothetical protein